LAEVKIRPVFPPIAKRHQKLIFDDKPLGLPPRAFCAFLLLSKA
jgi:hypothetical protein